MAKMDDIQTLDEMIAYFATILNAVHEEMLKRGVFEKMSELVMQAADEQDEDDLFKAEQLQSWIIRLSNIGVELRYMQQPVLKEHKLLIDEDLIVHLGNKVLEDGQKLEYLCGDKWNYGSLHLDKKSGKYMIWTWDAKVAVTDANGLRCRIRKTLENDKD